MSLKEIKARITSVRSTRKTTSAMKMVSSVKLRKSQQNLETALPYSGTLKEMLACMVTSKPLLASHPILKEREVKHCTVLALSSDSSLCGAFNSNIINRLKSKCDSLILKDVCFTVVPVGEKVARFAASQPDWNVNMSYSHLADTRSLDKIKELCGYLVAEFLNGRTDCVCVIYTHFKSAGQQNVAEQVFLPFPYLDYISDTEIFSDYIIEPGLGRFFDVLLPKVLDTVLYSITLESFTSEHAARVMAMQTATDNSDKLIEELTMKYNKSRQQAITNELLDLMGGESR